MHQTFKPESHLGNPMETQPVLPFPLQVIQAKKQKKNCCMKFKKGKRCKSCPGHKNK